MAKTNFAALTSENKTVWSRDVWKVARNMSFIAQFMGSSTNSSVQRITELTKSEKGHRAVLTLVADLTGDGVAGDDTLEGNEEAIQSYDQVIQIDQLRHANRHKGKMADQKSIVNFREQSRDVLAYWLADRLDQLAFLTLSGIAYTTKTNGAARTAGGFADLAFASDVVAPSTNRHFQWDQGTTSLVASATGSLVAGAVGTGDYPTYKMIVDLKAKAKDKFIRGVKGTGGEEVYHLLMTPQGMARLKMDSDFLANVRNAGVRGGKNPLFAGAASYLVDGMWIHEYRHVYNTTGLTSGNKWGSGGTIDGQRCLLLGAQALGIADIGAPEWNEKEFDYGNQQGIEVGKIFGFLKPQFYSNVDSATEDFGVIVCDTAI